MSKLTDISDKIKAKLPFGKKSEPKKAEGHQSTVRNGERFIYRDESDFTYKLSSPELTVVPPSYYDVVRSDEFAQARETASAMVENLNLGIQHAPVMDKIVELRATRIAVEGIMKYHLAALCRVYEDMMENQLQINNLKEYISIRQQQLEDVNATISALER